MKRRNFIKNTAAIAMLSPIPALGSTKTNTDQNKLDIPFGITNFHSFISNPVIIESIEVIDFKNYLFIQVKSKEGAIGMIPANFRLRELLCLFNNLVIPQIIGKDARDLEKIIDDIFILHYKYSGLAFWACVGHAELCILDLLGKIANLPVGKLFSTNQKDYIKGYLTTWYRDLTAEQTIEKLIEGKNSTGTQTLKVKIGGRMSKNQDSLIGRTNNLIPLIRKTFGNEINIYTDANGSYDAPKAIEIGKMLEDYGVNWFEEPCPWEDKDETKLVTDSLKKLLVTGGEQDTSLHVIKNMINNKVVKLIQPDIIYCGGFIRAMYIAKMAELRGMQIVPHHPHNGALKSIILQYASIVPNMGEYQEYNPEEFLEDYFDPKIKMINGEIKVLKNAGWGIKYNEEIWKSGKKII